MPDCPYTASEIITTTNAAGYGLVQREGETPDFRVWASDSGMIGGTLRQPFGGSRLNLAGITGGGDIQIGSTNTVLTPGTATRLSDYERVAFETGGSAGYVTVGLGSPEGTMTGPPGSLYLNAAGSAGTSLYVKESGTGNTGWVAK